MLAWKLPTILDSLEYSLASSFDAAEEEQRRQEINRRSDRLKKLARLGIHQFANQFPQTTAKIVDFPLEQARELLVGVGSKSTVFREDNMAIKVLRRSMYMSESERVRLAGVIAAEHAALARYLGNFILDQEVVIAAHPLTGRRRAVQIRQPLLEYDDPHIFDITDKNGVNADALQVARKTYPGIEDPLHSFVDDARRMHHDTGLVPDTLGNGNLLVPHAHKSSLVLLDGQPVPHADEVLRTLRGLETALEQPRQVA